MSEEMIVKHCAPTLAGLKTGNMFVADFEDAFVLRESLRHWNCQLWRKGLRFVSLYHRDGRALIYMFRPSRLSQDLQDQMAREVLQNCGYKDHSSPKCLLRLMERFGEKGEFPHEVGLFLGYPPIDVKGFIENKARNAKCVGFWKVYGDEKVARKQFELYRKCTRIYCEQWSRGKNIERLAVAG